MRNVRTLAIGLITLAGLGAPAVAVQPDEWVHETEADFKSAKSRTHAAATNFGRVRLSRRARLRARLSDGPSVIYDLARLPDGRTFAAAGPRGKLVKLTERKKANPEDGKPNSGSGKDDEKSKKDKGKPAQSSEKSDDGNGADGEKGPVDQGEKKDNGKPPWVAKGVEDYGDAQVFALEVVGEAVWVAVSGENSRLERWAGTPLEATRTIKLSDARYIWDMVPDGDHLWVGTGLPARVLHVSLDAKDAEPSVALETKQDNVLTLGVDGKGRVYAGTDGKGLIYRIRKKKGGGFEPFVLYEAPEPEIGGLLVLDDGTVYAGTADAKQARPGPMGGASEKSKGRPQKKKGGKEDGGNLPKPPSPDSDGDASSDAAEPSDATDGAETATDAATQEKTSPPTDEDYNALRKVIRERLEEARESGELTVRGEGRDRMATTSGGGSSGGSSGSESNSSDDGPATSGQGNAIYRIDPDGFVREVFRESVMILRLLRGPDGALLVATGNEGQLYRVDPADEQVTTLADLDAKQVPAVVQTEEGLLLGTANAARVVSVGSGYAKEGHLTSQPLDAGQVSLWGRMQILAEVPENTSLKVRTRSGNVSDPADGPWSTWSDPKPVKGAPSAPVHLEIPSPPARFLQYRLVLEGDAETTPKVSRVALKYLTPNLPPRIQSVKTEYETNDEKPSRQTTLKVKWKAKDPNGDELSYTLEARPWGTEAPFVPVAKDLDKTEHKWNTRTVADGRYVLRLRASDHPANVEGQARVAQRLSAPVLVDNTSPSIQDVRTEVKPDGSVAVRAKVIDESDAVAEARYAIDSRDAWNLVLPEDHIYDSTSETLAFTIPPQSPGAHRLTLRALDTFGNPAYFSTTVTVPEK